MNKIQLSNCLVLCSTYANIWLLVWLQQSGRNHASTEAWSRHKGFHFWLTCHGVGAVHSSLFTLSSILNTLVVHIRRQLNLGYRYWKECEQSFNVVKSLKLLSSHLSVLCSVERQLITFQWGYLVPPQQVLLNASVAEFLTRPSNEHPFS